MPKSTESYGNYIEICQNERTWIENGAEIVENKNEVVPSWGEMQCLSDFMLIYFDFGSFGLPFWSPNGAKST